MSSPTPRSTADSPITCSRYSNGMSRRRNLSPLSSRPPMTQLVRLAFVLGLGGIGILATAGPASAQYVGGGFAVPGLRTPGVQFNYLQTRQYSVGSGLGPGISFGYTVSGPVGYGIYNRNNNNQSSFLSTPSSSGYMTGGVRPTDAVARDFARAQQQAAAAIRGNPL